MQPIQVLLLIAALGLLLGIAVPVATHVARSRREQALLALLADVLPGASIRPRDGWVEAQTARVLFLLKPVPLAPGQELILTNPRTWAQNGDPGNWRRSTVPELVPGVEAFLDYRPESAANIVRIAVLMPSARLVTRYLNESDVEVVKPEKAVHGVHFVPLSELSGFLSERDQK